MTPDDLERRLADLAAHVEFPPTPSLAESVLATLAVRERSDRRRTALVLGLALVLVLGAVAAAVGLGVGGLRLVPGAAASVPQVPSGVSDERRFGDRADLEAAATALGFTPRLPTAAGLGPPDDVYVTGPSAGQALTIVWRDASGGIDLLITEMRADLGPDSFEKILAEGTELVETEVGGTPAWWIGGGEHPFYYRDADGRIVHDTLRLAEPALIWEADGLTLRVEGAGDLVNARRVAESLR